MKPLLTATAVLMTSPAVAEVPGVVTDTPVIHSLVSQVMGELGEPALLLDRGGDPHSFQLRPSQAATLADADLLFWVGPALTPWLERALDGTGLSGEAVALLDAEGVKVLEYGEAHDDHGHDDHAHDDHGHDEHAHDDHGHDDDAHDDHGHGDHAHEGADPHAWLDPANAAVWLGVIADHLSEADPANAATYAANAAAAIGALDALDAEIRGALAPVGDQPIFVFHDAYAYFAAAYGVNVAGTIALGDAADPGAQRLAGIRDELQTEGAACVFAEANHDPGYVNAVIEGTGIRTAVLDPSGALLDPGPDHYARTLRDLATTIAGCVTAGG